MDALVIHAPGDLRVEAVETPAVGPGQVRVRVRAGGICGSDLRYYQHGGFGSIRLQQPMVLGHEVAGIVDAVGDGVSGLSIGDRIAVCPSQPCGQCRYCQLGLQNHCLDIRYYGSAMRMPHVQGAFRQEIVIEAVQASGRPLAAGLGHAVVPRRGPCLRARGRPHAGDEGAAQLRLSLSLTLSLSLSRCTRCNSRP